MSFSHKGHTDSAGPRPDDNVVIENSKDARDACLQCEHCLKTKHDVAQLQKCASYKRTRYCSMECQKENWPLHKKRCRQNTETQRELAKLGPDYVSMSKELQAWTKYFRPTINRTILHALDIAHRGFERDALVIELVYDKSFQEVHQRFRIVSCRVEPLTNHEASISEMRLEVAAQSAHRGSIGAGVTIMHCSSPIETWDVNYQCISSGAAEEVIEVIEKNWKEVLMRTVMWEQDGGDDPTHERSTWVYTNWYPK